MLIPYKVINRVRQDSKIAGRAQHVPYSANLPKESLTPSPFNIFVHIMPASAPTGVMNAPRLEPITAP